MSGSLPFTSAPAEPQLKDTLDALKKSVMLDLNCHHVGTIQSFDASKQTATITINYKKTYYQLSAGGLYAPVLVDYPIMVDCPVVVLGGAKAALTFPIQKGDECLVLFNDRDLDNWFQGGTGAGTATARLHSFADGIALVGLRSLANSLANYDSTRAVLRNDKALVAVSPTKVKVANDTQNLLTLLQNVCAQINGLVDAFNNNAAAVVAVTGGPGGPSPINPAIVTALTAVKTATSTLSSNLGGLLE